MKLEEAIKSSKFRSEKEKMAINLLYSNYWLKNRYVALLKPEGVTLEQYNVMRILRGKHPQAMCIKDIASRIIEKNSNVPRIIDRLVKKSLATRTQSKEDKRETLINITEKGTLLLQKLTAITDNVSTSLLGITEEEARIMNELLEKMKSTP